MDAGGMNMKDIENAVEYHGDFNESFNQLIDRPQFFDTGEGYCGKLNKNEFWIYRKYPFITNSFRTVLYGTILNDQKEDLCQVLKRICSMNHTR